MKKTAVFDEADKLLDFSFSKELFETDSTEIMDTEITQVAIFLTSVAYYRVFIEVSDILPDSYAGHSVGYTGNHYCLKQFCTHHIFP